jgi:3-dehydroquinate synthase
MDVTRIPVELGDRSYDVFVGAGLLGRVDELLKELFKARGWRQVVIVTDNNVGPLYAAALAGGFSRAGRDVSVTYVEAGESSKSAPGALMLVNFLTRSLMTRSDLVVALGGGVVGDLTGFAASIFKRGVDILQVPTTLMSQVDAAIGGKTGVNLEQGKNLAGTFHQPVAVICDMDALKSLTEREYASGLAEVAKYSFLRPTAFDPTLESSAESLRDPGKADLEPAVASCAAIKAEVVSEDERDSGLRAILNYGHTLGHALEAATNYDGSYSHGEAVSIGMVYAALVAEAAGITDEGLCARHRGILERLGLPLAPVAPVPIFDSLAGHIEQDKKSRGEPAMVLLKKEGEPVIFRGLQWELLKRCYGTLVGG